MKGTEMIFGIRACMEAIMAGKEFDRIMVKRELKSDLSREFHNLLKKTSIPVQTVPVEKLNRVTGKNHQGVIGYVSAITYHNVENLLPEIYERGEEPFFLILDGVTDVRNFGAITRSAECAGVHGIIVPLKGGAAINADAIKTSAGALLKIPVCRVLSLSRTIRFFQESGLRVFAATEKGASLHTKTDLTGPLAVVMGAEDTGVSTENLRYCDGLIKIPMLGTISSLNVSVAAGILTYEVVRQRGVE